MSINFKSLKHISVVVIGGSHAGLGLSHRLLEQAPGVSIKLVNPSDEYYFNIAAPRFLVKPDSLQLSQYIHSIPESFRDYPSRRFTFIDGLVTNVDLVAKSIAIRKRDASNMTLPYDYLIIASGSTTPATVGDGSLKLPLKPNGFEDLRATIRETQAKIQNSMTVAIGGGGPLGVELAGELAEASGPSKTVTLISGSRGLLPGLPGPVKQAARSLLDVKGVDILESTTVDRVEHDQATRKWIVRLSTGRKLIVDAYISATGVIPNNQFIPRALLNEDGWINVDEHLRVRNNGECQHDVYALGDITAHPYRLLSRISAQISTVVASITASIRGQGHLVTYFPEAQRKMTVIPVGGSTGTGHLGGWTLPGFVVYWFKGKDYLIHKAPKFLKGQD
ncbi:FAD/NAD(P)-binding domain-containing protein [Aspergillus insuetus]